MTPLKDVNILTQKNIVVNEIKAKILINFKKNLIINNKKEAISFLFINR